jgi:hypothetical protein
MIRGFRIGFGERLLGGRFARVTFVVFPVRYGERRVQSGLAQAVDFTHGTPLRLFVCGGRRLCRRLRCSRPVQLLRSDVIRGRPDLLCFTFDQDRLVDVFRLHSI